MTQKDQRIEGRLTFVLGEVAALSGLSSHTVRKYARERRPGFVPVRVSGRLLFPAEALRRVLSPAPAAEAGQQPANR